MTHVDDHNKIPDPVPPVPLPEFEYEELEMGEQIGLGGDADVYRAAVDHDGYTYTVAVKQPRFKGTIQKSTLEKFQAEAETWASLNDHDNVVSVYSWGYDPVPWLGLEYMDGGTLEKRLGSAGTREALWLAGRIAEGIHHGHRHGVAHLDIKPSNVLLRDTGSGTWNYPKVSDWGLAKMLLDHSNSIEGISPTYAAPEQFDAEKYGKRDDRTDIYQLGNLVYALLTGEPPFSGPSASVLQSVLQEDPTPPSEINADLSESVDEVVLKALEKRKDDRYESVVIFRQELDRLFTQFVDDGYEITDSESGAVTTEAEDRTPVETTDVSSNDDESSLLTRRRAMGVLGVGIVGGGGLLATTLSDGGTNGSGTTILTGSPTTTPSEARTGELTGTSTEEPEIRTTSGGSEMIDSPETGQSADRPSGIGGPTETETGVDGSSLFYDDFQDSSYEDSWDVTMYHDAESISEENGVLTLESPPSETAYANDMLVESRDTISGSGRQTLEVEHRVATSDYWLSNIVRLYEVGSDNRYILMEKNRQDALWSRATANNTVTLSNAADSTDWITYRITIDFDAGTVISVERGGQRFELDQDLGSGFDEYILGLGDPNATEQYRSIRVIRG